jgi:predicted PurR-regulated permease PerM
MVIDYYLVKKPLYLNLQEDFIGTTFSFPMVPIIITYGMFILIVYLIWRRMRQVLIRVNEIELKNSREEGIIHSLQQVTSIMAKNITEQNNTILEWINENKAKGKKISQKVERSSKMIALALQSLSEISFILPYNRDVSSGNLEELESMLQEKIETLQNLKK